MLPIPLTLGVFIPLVNPDKGIARKPEIVVSVELVTRIHRPETNQNSDYIAILFISL